MANKIAQFNITMDFGAWGASANPLITQESPLRQFNKITIMLK